MQGISVGVVIGALSALLVDLQDRGSALGHARGERRVTARARDRRPARRGPHRRVPIDQSEMTPPATPVLKGRPVIETQLLADSTIVCRPSGGLDWIAAVSLRHATADWLRPGVKIVIDLSRVDFVDAVGISAIVGSVRRVRAVGGRAQICGASGQVQRSMELAGVGQLATCSSVTTDNDAA